MKHCRMMLGALGAAALLGACDDGTLKDKYYGRLVYDVLPDSARGASQDPGDPELHYRQFVLSQGYVGGNEAYYLDLGTVDAPTLPNVYVATHGGKPVAGQYPIVDTLPGQADYASMWHVVTFEVPSSYEANDVKSLKGIERNDYTLKDTNEAMYCAVVNPDATWFLPDGTPIFDATMGNVFYGTGEDVLNPAFDPSLDPPDPATPPTISDAQATENDLRLVPVWHKRLLGFCFPGMLDAQRAKRYDAVAERDEADKFTGNWTLSDAALGTRIDFYTPVDPETGEQGPWGTPALFTSASTADNYSPVALAVGLESEMPPEATTAEGLDLSAAAPLAVVDNPIILEVAPPPPEESTDGSDAAAMQ